MKKLFSVLMIASLLTLSIVGTVRAQLPGTAIKAAIPFDFIVRGITLPAGTYEITRINDEPIALMIRNTNHKRERTMFETEPVYVADTPRKNVLVFHRYGDSYFLSEVLTSDGETGRELGLSRAERRIRRDLAKNQAELQIVTVALN